MTTNKGDATRRQLKNVSLFGADDEVALTSNELSIDKIKLPDQQPRSYFDPEKQANFMASIEQHGILEPILVRPIASLAPGVNGNDYELVAGERRYRAAQALNLQKVPVIVREMTDREAQQIALVENLQRENLNPIEETEAILSLLSLELNLQKSEVIALLHQLKKQDKNNVIPKVEEVFTSLGTMGWLSFVQNRLPLLNLPREVLEALRQGKIAYTKARAIGQVKDDDARQALLTEAIKSDLSLVDIRGRVDDGKKGSKPVGDLGIRLGEVYKRVKKAKLWDDPEKKQQLKDALDTLEKLLNSPPL
jgi:ParB family transcriptional regulator, chromosome partitioning protein